VIEWVSPSGGVSSDPLRVLIADDDAPSRILTGQALDGRGFVVVGEVGDATAAVAAARRDRPDICLVDVRMPGGGIRATAEIVDAVPDTTVVMFTASQSDTDLFDALRAGASGYLFKNTDPARLPLALHGVFRGEAALPRTLAARLIEEFRQRERRKRLPLPGGRGVDLTSREWDVLEFMRQGFTTAQMAERLYVSQVTVRTHVSSIKRKLRLPDRDAVRRLFEER
jgi:DNA-binding NarL/FixJ family response regulator